MSPQRPNVLFLFPDQLGRWATGFGGDPNARTPNLDALAAHSVDFVHAASGCPVCSPARASLMTGQYPLRHGVFLNDAPLRTQATTLGRAFRQAGYKTAYIGKWHLNGAERAASIPPKDRLGFESWRALGCTHDYTHSLYYADDETSPRQWPAFDALAQTDEAERLIRTRDPQRPFFLALAWGPPHEGFGRGGRVHAPDTYRQLFEADRLVLRPNVPEGPVEDHPPFAQYGPARRAPGRTLRSLVRERLVDYYAYIALLDEMVGRLLAALDREGLADNTVVMFWSDHGDMAGAHARMPRQSPWDECIRVPLLVRFPRAVAGGRTVRAPIDAPDLMPTLLGLCGLSVPDTVQGRDYGPLLRSETDRAPAHAALVACYHPFAGFARALDGREYRGLRTERHTYVRSLGGPWLLYDNQADPFQMENLVDRPEYAALQRELEDRLRATLTALGDEFAPSDHYLSRWGYAVRKADGSIPYRTQP